MFIAPTAAARKQLEWVSRKGCCRGGGGDLFSFFHDCGCFVASGLLGCSRCTLGTTNPFLGMCQRFLLFGLLEWGFSRIWDWKMGDGLRLKAILICNGELIT